MPQAIVTVAQKYDPKQGGKTFGIKDQNGTDWKVWNNMNGLIQVGGSYEFQYKVLNFRGTDYNMVDSIKPAQQGQQTASANSGGYPGPAKGQQSPDAKDEVIFVTGGILRAIQAGRLDPMSVTDLAGAGAVLRDAFKQIWHRQPAKTAQVDPEMNDEIPF